MHPIAIILLCLACFVLGAIAYAKLHTEVSDKIAAEKEALTDEYDNLLARAHTERDKLFALVHPAAKPVTASSGTPANPAPASPAPIDLPSTSDAPAAPVQAPTP